MSCPLSFPFEIFQENQQKNKKKRKRKKEEFTFSCGPFISDERTNERLRLSSRQQKQMDRRFITFSYNSTSRQPTTLPKTLSQVPTRNQFETTEMNAKIYYRENEKTSGKKEAVRPPVPCVVCNRLSVGRKERKVMRFFRMLSIEIDC